MNKKLRLVEFKKEHLLLPDIAPMVKLSYGVDLPVYSEAVEKYSTSATAVDENDEVYGCFGILPLCSGVCDAWSCIPEKTKKYPLQMVKIGRAFFNKHRDNFRRIQMATCGDRAGRFAEALGFIYEGNMYNYGENGETYDRYALI